MAYVYFFILAINRDRTGLNYSELAVVVEKGSFSTTDQIGAIVKDLSSRYVHVMFLHVFQLVEIVSS